MGHRKQIIAVLIVCVAGVLLIAGWMEYKEGKLFTKEAEHIEDLKVPLAPLATEGDLQTANATTMDTKRVVLKTNKGDITLELFTGSMPITTGNFLKLASEGFYNGTKFHRVIDGFMVQGGDPNSKSDNTSVYGQGGPGYTIQDEFVEGDLLTNTRGTIAMANTGQPNSGGSQFFINLVDNTGLDFDKQPFASRHPVFGRVVEGMGAVDLIAKTETGARDIPVEPIIIEEIITLEESE